MKKALLMLLLVLALALVVGGCASKKDLQAVQAREMAIGAKADQAALDAQAAKAAADEALMKANEAVELIDGDFGWRRHSTPSLQLKVKDAMLGLTPHGVFAPTPWREDLPTAAAMSKGEGAGFCCQVPADPARRG